MHQEIVVLLIVIASGLYVVVHTIKMFRIPKQKETDFTCSSGCSSCFSKKLPGE